MGNNPNFSAAPRGDPIICNRGTALAETRFLAMPTLKIVRGAVRYIILVLKHYSLLVSQIQSENAELVCVWEFALPSITIKF